MTGLARRAFSLIEIVVAMTLTMAVFAITLPFVRTQTRALGTTAGRLDADQLARYAQRAIDRDLRLATADPGQPLIVYAGPMAIVFNANHLAADTTDPGATDVEPGAPSSLTEAWRLADAAVLPYSARRYPDQDYLDRDGNLSHVETISYFLHPDTVSGRNDLWVLYRRVNARDSVQLVRGLYVPADSAFFSYYRPVGGVPTRFAPSRLPLYWDSLAVDSVRSIGIHAVGFYRDRLTGAETIRAAHWISVLRTAARRSGYECRGTLRPVDAVTAVLDRTSQPYRVRLTWSRSPDDYSPGGIVRRYIVSWRADGSGGPWRALATLTATGATSYEWDHASPPGAGSVVYAVRAMGCGESFAEPVATLAVTYP